MLPEGHLREALTFDDVLLVPAESDVLPRDVDVATQLTATIRLAIPILSSAMDTVTEARTAICMAREGGLGILHKNMGIAEQALEVTKVKKAETGVVVDPVTIGPDQKLSEALALMRRYDISGLPVVGGDGRPVGILTNRDVRFERNLDQPVRAMMTTKLVTVPEGTGVEASKELLHQHRIEKLLVVDGAGKLKGLITIKDIEKAQQHPNAVKDEHGRLRVGRGGGHRAGSGRAGLGAAGRRLRRHLRRHRPRALARRCWRRWRTSARPSRKLADHRRQRGHRRGGPGAGQGRRRRGQGGHRSGLDLHHPRGGGVGVPQITAIADCARALERTDVPVIADGGIKYSGDVAKALAAGAHTVMIGSLFAGTDEAPGEVILYQGRSYKVYRGMGSLGAMRAGSKDRYFQADVVQRGQAGARGHRGPRALPGQPVAVALPADRRPARRHGLLRLPHHRRAAHQGALRARHPVGPARIHVHDVIITKEAPNYRVEQ